MHRTFKLNARQTAAILERRIRNYFRACRNFARGYRIKFYLNQRKVRIFCITQIIRIVILIEFQAIATRERTLAYARYAVANGYTRQPTATIERMIAYARYAVANGYTRQTIAIKERIRAYTRYAIRNYHAC